ncbi:protein translocase subunit SecF [Candidatus Uhrbacteria bacterium]|nr:protein translocase subunit SecF [Candidatus Uhrbacteria bacterium]
MIPIVQTRRVWLTCSAIISIASIIALALWQLQLGIDFTGGSFLEVSYSKERPANEAIQERFIASGLKEVEVKAAGAQSAIMRFSDVDEATHQKILTELKKDDAALIEKSFQSIGPVIGEELKRKSVFALIIVLVAILLYITYVFRKVSYPVESWKYGTAAVIALFHDALFVLGAFAVLGKFGGVEIASSFIPAFLTVLGFSVHDSIVVFDRIRENLIKTRGEFADIVNQSFNQTFARSINTSVTVLLVLLAVYFLGGETMKNFALTLILGISIGTYSSIFVASTLLVVWHGDGRKRA